VVATLAAMAYVLYQARKPGRTLGRLVLLGMNRSHSALTDWGLRHVEIAPDFRILDVGCGGGRTIEKLAALAPNGHVEGVDYADGSVAASRAHNARLIRAGRVAIHHAAVSKLPYPDRTFDLVTSIESHYYWPDLTGDLRELLRVTKPGGTALVIAEFYLKGRMSGWQELAMKPLRAAHLTREQHEAWFVDAGFTGVQVFEDARHGWLCVMGRRPAEA